MKLMRSLHLLADITGGVIDAKLLSLLSRLSSSGNRVEIVQF